MSDMSDMSDMHDVASYVVIGHNKSPCRSSAQLHTGILRD